MNGRRTAFLAAFLCAGAVRADATPTPLVPGAAVEKRLDADETHEYVASLQAGDYLAVNIEERGVDIALSIFDAQGKLLTEQQTTYSRSDADRVRLIATRSGEFRLVVTAKSAPGASYFIHTLALRPSTALDRREVAASDAFHKGLRTGDRATPAAIRAAIREFGIAMENARASRDSDLVGDAALLAGRLAFRLDQRDEAVALTTQALAAFRASGNTKREARALNNLGAIYQEMARPAQAISYLTQALATVEITKDSATEAMVLHNLGWYHQLLGEYSASSNYYRRALRAEGDEAARAATLNNLGRLSASLGDFDAAREFLQQALTECTRQDDRRCQAETLVNLGSVSLRLQEVDAARARFTEALSTMEGIQIDAWRAKALLGLASVASDAASQAAGDNVRAALALTRSIKDGRLEADALKALGDWQRARKNVALAKESYERALALQRATNEIDGEAQSRLALAELFRDAGDLEQAVAQVTRAIDARESVRQRVARPDLRSTYLATTQEYYDLYVDILMALHARKPLAGYDRKALQASERARARGLIEALAERGTDILSRSNPELVARERALRRTLNARDERLRALANANGGGTQELATARQQLATTIGELRELQGEIRSRAPRYAELMQPPTLDVAALQHRIDDDSVLLEYWLGTKRSFVWAVTSHGIASYVLPAGDTIEAAAREYFAVLTTRPARAGGDTPAVLDEAAGRALSRALLAPVAKELAKRRVIVVRYGALEYIPFAALPAPDSSEPNLVRLIQRHEIVNLPAATVLGALHRVRRPAPRKTIAIFADPVFSGDDPRVVRAERADVAPLAVATRDTVVQANTTEAALQPFRRLRYSRLEADAIAALVPADERFEALDFNANRAAALDSHIAEFRFLHFATHGLLDSVHPELSGLLFSTVDQEGRPRDGRVRLPDIFGMSLRADLVVLSACQTALGREIKGEGLVGLTRGFMYAGAPRVIAALWNVDDRATAELMTRFYTTLLKERATTAVSLRAAQLALLEEPRWSSPYYWAGLVLQGDWR